MELSKRQIDALKKSIEKWKLIVAGKGTDKGYENCQCCIIYDNENKVQSCSGCPIKKESGRSGCANTPWVTWREYQGKHDFFWFRNEGIKVFDKESKRLAKAELDFLKKILKEAK